MRFQGVGTGNSALSGVALLLGGCSADLTGMAGDDARLATPSEATGGEDCEVEGAEAVPKLLRLSHFEYRSVVTDLLGVEIDEALLESWTPLSEVHGFDTMSESRIDARGLEEQLRTVEQLAESALTSPAFDQACPGVTSETLTWESCGKSLSTTLGSRAFRRPLKEEEITGYGSLFTLLRTSAANASLAAPDREALLGVVQAILLSPHLTFKPELVPQGFDEVDRSFARASKLSLYARSSIPDDELWAAAVAGRLETEDDLELHVRRLLEADPSRFLTGFGGQWLGFRDLPLEADSLLGAMREETRAVFSAVFEEEMLPGDLLSPGFTIVAPELAQHYGLPAEGAGEPQRLSSEERGGVLAQGYFLKRTATGSDFRRAVHRGLWVITRLLCQEIPRIDAATLEEISASFDTIDRTLPLAEQMEIHRNSASRCSGCHSLIDPIGLALENYDPEGLWRDVDPNGHPITSDLELLGQVVDSPATLSRVIRESEEYETCVATKLLTYAFNRAPSEGEKCMGREFMVDAKARRISLKEAAVQAVIRSFDRTEISP